MNETAHLHDDVAEILLTEERDRGQGPRARGADQRRLRGRRLTLVSVLKGSLPFMADLMRAIDIPVRIDLMEVSSYGGSATESSGLVRILKDLSASIADEDVLIVEDIIDTGLTLNYLIRYLRGKAPASLRICTLLDKPARRLVEIPVDYTGFTIPDQFVVGYGLDYGELYRNLRYVGRAQAGGLLRGPRRMTMHRRPLGRGRTLAALAGPLIVSAACCRGGRSAARRASRRSRATAWRAAGSSSSSSGSRRWPSSPCRTPRATGRSGSIAGCRSPSWRWPAGSGFGWRVIELALIGAFQFSTPGRRSSPTGRACGWPASGWRSCRGRPTS